MVHMSRVRVQVQVPRDLNEVINYLNVENLTDSWLSEKTHTLGQYELVRVNRIAKDIAAYLEQLISFIQEQLQYQNELSYFCENRAKIRKASKVVCKISAFLREAFCAVNVVGEVDGGDYSANANVVMLLRTVTSQSMDAMICVTTMTRRLDMAMNLMDLQSVVREIQKEMGHCQVQLGQLQESPPILTISKIRSFDSLSEYLQTISFSECDDLSTNAPFMLMTSETEKDYLQAIHAFGGRIEPIQVSFDLLQERVGNLDLLREHFLTKISTLKSDTISLKEGLSVLCSGYVSLKNDTLMTRVMTIFGHIKTQVEALIKELFVVVDTGNIDQNRQGFLYKTCSAALGLLQKVASSPSLRCCNFPEISGIISEWNRLNGTLSELTKLPVTSGLRPSMPSKNNETLELSMKSIKLGTPQAEVASNTSTYSTTSQCLGLGINLHLGIEPSPGVPFSIAKKDRIVNLQMDSSFLPKACLSQAMLHSLDDNTQIKNNMNLEQQISLPSTPAMFALGSPLNIGDVPTTETTPFYTINSNENTCYSQYTMHSTLSEEKKDVIFRELMTRPCGPSRIPTILPNYSDFNLPVFKKRYDAAHEPSRIPTISPDNEVFFSPERRCKLKPHSQDTSVMIDVPFLKHESLNYQRLLSPPQFLIAHDSKTEHSKPMGTKPSKVLGDVTNNVSGDRGVYNSRKLSLNETLTPNLAHSNQSRVSWNSTSPERPKSSMGSRFDEKHLIQPLKHLKKPWK